MREKQIIEEMTKDLCAIECKGMKCDTCDGYACEYRMQAEALYNAGYRKQKKAEWKSGKTPNGQWAIIARFVLHPLLAKMLNGLQKNTIIVLNVGRG